MNAGIPSDAEFLQAACDAKAWQFGEWVTEVAPGVWDLTWVKRRYQE